MFTCPSFINETCFRTRVDESQAGGKRGGPADSHQEGSTCLGRGEKSSCTRQNSPGYWRALAFTEQEDTKWPSEPQ